MIRLFLACVALTVTLGNAFGQDRADRKDARSGLRSKCKNEVAKATTKVTREDAHSAIAVCEARIRFECAKEAYDKRINRTAYKSFVTDCVSRP